MPMKVLLLNSSFYPIKIIDWKRAMNLFFGGRAQIVEQHSDKFIKSPNQDYPLPKVIRLYSRFSYISPVKFSRDNVLYRDEFTCQYCFTAQAKSELTLDHVMPRSRGGETSWRNIVAACKPCNNRKADKTPTEAQMPLKRIPKEPSYLAILLKKTSKVQHEFENWLI